MSFLILITLILAISYSDATPPPVSVASPTFAPTPKLAPRCDDGDCTFGGSATTLQASVVTTTILSTTSVPCYITSFVTDHQTSYSTVYSTQILTSTITEEGTVYIVHYSPTPILKSSQYETVIPVTVTGTTMWLEEQGSAWDSTVTGGKQTIGGAPNPPITGSVQGGWAPAATAAAGGPVAGNAWTHVGLGVKAGVATAGAVGATVNAANGWTAGNGVGSGNNIWSSGSQRAESCGCGGILAIIMVAILLLETMGSIW